MVMPGVPCANADGMEPITKLTPNINIPIPNIII